MRGMRSGPGMLRVLSFALAMVFALPACFTAQLWNEKIDYPGSMWVSSGPQPSLSLQGDAAATLYVPIDDAVRARLQSVLPLLQPGVCGLVLELAADERVAEFRNLPRAEPMMLFAHVPLDGSVTADLRVGPRTYLPVRLRAAREPVAGPVLASLRMFVSHEVRDDTPVVVRVLLTPVAVALDVVFLPFSLLGFFAM